MGRRLKPRLGAGDRASPYADARRRPAPTASRRL